MKNKYEIRGDVTIIYVTRKGNTLEAIIDTEDLYLVEQYKNTWCTDKGSYVYSSDKKIKLHRLVMKAPSDKMVDHINHDALDNRKINLRLCTHSQNMQNIKGAHKSNKTSGIRGVSWSKGMKKWEVKLMSKRMKFHLGYYENLNDAKEVSENGRSKLMEFSKEALENLSPNEVVIHSPHKSDMASGVKGIHWDHFSGSWRVQYKTKKLSKRFKNLGDAITALDELKSATR